MKEITNNYLSGGIQLALDREQEKREILEMLYQIFLLKNDKNFDIIKIKI